MVRGRILIGVPMAVVALLTPGCVWVRGSGVEHPSPETLAEARDVDRAQDLVDEGLYDQARKRLDALFRSGCRHPQAFMLEAKIAYEQGDYEAALPWCEKALETSSLWIEPRIISAQSNLKLKRFEPALSIFQDIDKLAPDSPWGPYGLGVVHAQRGDTASATKELDRALQRDPKHGPSLEARAGIARMLQQRAVEESLLKRYVIVEPLDAGAFERLGEIAQGQSHLEDARRAFERAYALARMPEASRALAELARRRGDSIAETLWSTRAGLSNTPPPIPDTTPSQ